jgi:hypothetical protein
LLSNSELLRRATPISNGERTIGSVAKADD